MNRQNIGALISERVSARQVLMASLIPLLVITLVLLSNTSFSQYKINQIITDYNGYWKSSATAINTVKPDNSHNLLAFSYYGKTYSTGVNDTKLTTNGDLFIPGDYRALPVQAITGAVNANTKIGVGEKYDGVTGGKSTPSPINNIPYYLTDGIKGLDIGTCIANLPVGKLSFAVTSINLAAINDSIPDVVITQTADPSGSDYDRYEFTDIEGNRVGNYVDIVLSSLPSVGTWVADFYEASTNPMTLSPGYVKTERGLRLWAADFGVFGINATNISRVAYFKISLNGNSDVAFVAYNNNAVNVGLILPTKLTSFTGKTSADGNDLNWQTATESNSAAFIIERSFDGSAFMSIGSVKAAGNSNNRRNYSFKAPAISGRSFYRLKMVDLDGKAEYSTTISLSGSQSTTVSISAYPNPANASTWIKHPFVTGVENIQLFSAQGILVNQIKATNNQTLVDVSRLTKGNYHVVFSSDSGRQASTLIVQ